MARSVAAATDLAMRRPDRPDLSRFGGEREPVES